MNAANDTLSRFSLLDLATMDEMANLADARREAWIQDMEDAEYVAQFLVDEDYLSEGRPLPHV